MVANKFSKSNELNLWRKITCKYMKVYRLIKDGNPI